MTSTSTQLSAGALIASRYRAEEALPSDRHRRAFIGTDEQTGQRVLMIELSANDAGSLGPILRIEHAYLAKLHDIVQMLGTAVIAAELVPGTTLDAHLRAGHHDHPVEAVRAILRVADAVSAIHNAGGAHGGVCPEAIVFDPSGRAGPVVGFAPAVIGLSAYRSPDRGEVGPPSEADDAWAVAGLLHLMLTGKEPPIVGIRSESDLSSSVADPTLRTTLAHALAADAHARPTDLKTLKRELARWFVDHAGEEPSYVGRLPGSHKPPPLPPPAPGVVAPPVSAPTGAAALGAASRAAPKSGRGKLVVALAVVGTLFGVGAAWGVSALRKRPGPAPETSASAAVPASAAPSGNAIDLTEQPVTSAKDAGTGDKMTTCVAGYLPKGSFVATPTFEWLCGEADPRMGADRLRTAIVFGGNQVQVTEAMKIFSRIGWYDMPAYAVVRAGCCPDAKPLELPAVVDPCPDMAQALRDIAKSVLASDNYDEPLARYTKSANCELSANRGYIYKRHGKPQFYQEQAFRELIKATNQP